MTVVCALSQPLSLFIPGFKHWHCHDVVTVQAAGSRPHTLSPDVTRDADLRRASCWSPAPPGPLCASQCPRHSRTHCHTPGPDL